MSPTTSTLQPLWRPPPPPRTGNSQGSQAELPCDVSIKVCASPHFHMHRLARDEYNFFIKRL